MLCRQRKEKILKLQDHLSVSGVAVTHLPYSSQVSLQIDPN